MAVVQISQIQIRRGLLQDLGQLNSGEFGWAVDRLRLFIGNGTISDGAPYEGNTEILTTNSDILELLGNYTYKGLLGGYRVNTGISGIAPTLRTFQDKVDDFVNIRDFGATGDGLTDDSDAIERAIYEIYGRRTPLTPTIARRTINFHPGVYRVTRDILLPPYTSLRNSGKDSVIIQQVGVSANCVIRTTDATGDWLSLTDLSKLGPVEISGITFKSDISTIPVLIIESARDISFQRCKLLGHQSNGNLLVANNSRIASIKSTSATTTNIYFTECDFAYASSIIEIENYQGMTNIHVDKSTISHGRLGITTNSNVASVVGLRVTNTLFANIALQGLVTESTVDGVVSAFNTYVNVGHNYQSEQTPVSPVIEFKGNVNYSFADIFTRSESHAEQMPTVKHNGKLSVSTDATTSLRYGNTFQTVGKTRLLNNASVNYIPLPVNTKQGFVSYAVERGTGVRSGTINYAFNDSQNVEFHESYTDNGQSGITLEPVYSSHTGNSKPYLLCTVDSSGYSSALTYDIKSLSNTN